MPEDVRVWVAGGVAATVAVLGAGFVLLVDPQLKSADDQRAQSAAALSQNALLTARLEKLAVQSRQLGNYQAEIRRVLVQLPITNGITDYAQQVATQAAAAHVAVTNLAIGGITLSSVSAAAAATAPATESTDPSTTTATPTATPTAAADGSTGTGATTGTAGTAATTAAGQVFQISYTVTTSGTLQQQQAFLTQLQDIGPRVALVNSIQVAPGTTSEAGTLDSNATMTTDLDVFTAPQSAAETAALKKELDLRAPK